MNTSVQFTSQTHFTKCHFLNGYHSLMLLKENLLILWPTLDRTMES